MTEEVSGGTAGTPDLDALRDRLDGAFSGAAANTYDSGLYHLDAIIAAIRGALARASAAEAQVHALRERVEHLDQCVLLMDETVVLYQRAVANGNPETVADTLMRTREAVSTARFLMRAALRATEGGEA